MRVLGMVWSAPKATFLGGYMTAKAFGAPDVLTFHHVTFRFPFPLVFPLVPMLVP